MKLKLLSREFLEKIMLICILQCVFGKRKKFAQEICFQLFHKQAIFNWDEKHISYRDECLLVIKGYSHFLSTLEKVKYKNGDNFVF